MAYACYYRHWLEPATALPQATLSDVVAKVPPTRLADALPELSCDPEVRVRHARGQSLPDWLEMHSGDVNTFPDGVATARVIR